MPFYHVKIRYTPNRLMKAIMGEGDTFRYFYNSSEETIVGVREAQKKDEAIQLHGWRINSKSILAINVYKTEKSTKELSACYDGQTELVRA